jgi:predicted nucleic acid-binding protein
MYLVDTNMLSEARRGTSEPRDWLRSVDPNTVFLSVISVGEIMKGIALKQRTDPRAAASLLEWLERLRRDHANRVLPINDDIALTWGRLAAERPRPIADGLIAATASVHGKTIVTRNVRDFEDTSIPIINPWQQT